MNDWKFKSYVDEQRTVQTQTEQTPGLY